MANVADLSLRTIKKKSFQHLEILKCIESNTFHI